MKALIYVLAIVLMAAGAVVALISFFSPGQVVLGLNLGLAVSLVAGGVMTLALAAVISALEDLAGRLARMPASPPGERGAARAEAGTPSRERMAAALGAGAAMTAATAEASAVAGEETEEAVESVREQAPMERHIFVTPGPADEVLVEETEVAAAEAPGTSEEAATEEASEGAEETVDEAAEEPVAEEQAADEQAAEEEAAGADMAEAAEEAVEEADEEAGVEADEEDVDIAGLYVVEERVIRGRPARMLSDGTVEAETDEGWMRFENLEHLEEYMEAMSHAR